MSGWSALREPSRRSWALVLLSLVSLALPLLGVGCAGRRTGKLLSEFALPLPKKQVGRPVWLAAFAADELAGSLDASGLRLLYASDDKGGSDIWVKDLTTGLPRRLTKHAAVDTQPAWFPDGKRVVFVSMRKDAKGDLYLWKEGKETRLTGSESAESYPTVAPDGSIYYAAGDVTRTRILRLRLGDKSGLPVSRWNATHPAVSADGRYLAFTWFDPNRRGRIVVKRLSDERTFVLTTPDYHAGFPTFSPDGRYLAFVRFHRGEPDRPRTVVALGSLWRVSLAAVLAGKPAETLMQQAQQLSSDRRDVLLPHWHRRGIVFSGRHAGSLDVGLLPGVGLVPKLGDGAAQLALARAQRDPWDRLLALRWVREHGDRRARAEGAVLAADTFAEQAQFEKAKQALREAVALGEAPYAELAQINALTLPVRQERWRLGRGQDNRWRAAAEAARAQLVSSAASTTPRVAALRLLRLGDMHRLLGQTEAAMKAYEELLARHAEHREEAAEAKLRLGQVYERTRTPDLLARYYLTIFSLYPKQRAVLERTSRAILKLFASLPADEEQQRLRALVDGHRDNPLFCARALARVAALHERAGRTEMAVRTLSEVVALDRKLGTLGESAFALGRLSLHYAALLRKQGRVGEALGFYGQALGAYEQMMRAHEPATELYDHARREYLRLALREAGQLARGGDRGAAEKRYRRLIAFDRDVVAAHRELARLQLARGLPVAQLVRPYQQAIDKDGSDYVGRYMLGFLALAKKRPSKGDLGQAEGLLSAAISLRPQDPFGHLTLGWVYEMRERYLGETGRGWMEEAIVRYERAQALNDQRIDPQTTADLLINLGNAFVALGSDWKQVHGFCEAWRKLGYPPRSAAQEAHQLLSCGRAASATKRYEEASRSFERAAELAKQLKLKNLSAELGLRLALNEHLRGNYEASNQLFLTASEQLKKQGRGKLLAGLWRTMGYNAILAGKQGEALIALDRASELLRTRGAPKIAAFASVAAPGGPPSTAPLGFDGAGEHRAELALREIVRENRNDLRKTLTLQQRRVVLMAADGEKATPQEQSDLLVLRNRLALTALGLGERALFSAQQKAALAALAAQRKKDKKFTDDAPKLALELALALNGAEEALGRLARGHSVPQAQLLVHARRLAALERRRAALQLRAGNKLQLAARLRLALWTDLALLIWRADDSSAQTTAAGSRDTLFSSWRSHRPEPSTKAITTVLGPLLRKVEPMSRALLLLSRVFDETQPAQPVQEAAASAARASGPLASIWRPMTAREQLRWHIQAGLTSSTIATAMTPASELDKHPSTEVLQQLAKLGLQFHLGNLRYVLVAELAYRRRSLPAMVAAIDGFLQRPLLLASRADALAAAQQRERIFGRAIALAAELGRGEQALSFAEQQERRAFADALLAQGPRVPSVGGTELAALLKAGEIHRVILAGQDPSEPEAARGAWEQSRLRAERRVAEALVALRKRAPAVADLLTVGPFPLAELRSLLGKREVALGAVIAGDRAWIYALRRQGAVRLLPLAGGVRALRDRYVRDRRVVEHQLEKALGKLLGEAEQVRLDLGRLVSGLRPTLPKSVTVSPIATLWTVLDADQVRLPTLKPAVLAAGPTIPSLEGYERLGGTKLDRGQLETAAAKAGVLVLARPLRFNGRSAASAVVSLLPGPKAKAPRLSWQLASTLGEPLRFGAAVLADLRHTKGRERAERVALLRLLHAMGVARVLFPASPAPSTAGALSLAERLARLPRSIDELGESAAARALGFELYGDAGVAPALRAKILPRLTKVTTFAGAKAFNGRPRNLPGTIRLLERAVRLMDYTGQRKYLAGALLYLANATALLGDPLRAQVPMQRLLDLRREAVKKAPAGRKKVAAQTLLVKALEQLTWLQIRTRRYVAALKASGKAIEIYDHLKQRRKAGTALTQRSRIGEDTGDFVTALRTAREAATVAESMARKSKKVSLRLLAADRWLRVGRLLRIRFSRYREAMQAAERAQGLLPALQVAALHRLHQSLLPAPQPAGKAPAKEARKAKKTREAKKARVANKTRVAKKARVAKKGKAIDPKTLMARRLRSGQLLAKQHVAVVLEIARIQAARGAYAEAVRRCEEALELCRKVGNPEGLSLLDLVNNLYYVGDYRRALRMADQGLLLSKREPQRRIQFLNVKGTTLSRTGRSREALDVLKAALALAKQTGLRGEVAASHNNIGDALRTAGSYQDALTSFRAALDIDRSRADKLGVSFDLANLGLTSELLGLADRARQQLEEARKLAQSIGAPLNQLKALAGLSRLALRARRFPLALAHAESGQQLAARLGLREWLWRFHLLAGRAEVAAGRPKRAQEHFQRGLKIVDERPPRLLPAIRAPRTEEQPEELVDEQLELLAQAKDAQASFLLAERARRRRLIDRLSRNTPRLPWAAAGTVLSAYLATAADIEALRSARLRAVLQAEKAPAARKQALTKDRAAIDARLATLEKVRVEQRRKLSALNPRLPQLVELSTIELARLQRALPADAALVAYYPGRRQLLAWTLTREKLTLHSRALPRPRLEALVARFRQQLLRFQDAKSTARQLYGVLLAPLTSALAGKRRLIVVASGALQLLPFAGLHDGKDYLVARLTVSSLQSAAALLDPVAASSERQEDGGWASFGPAAPKAPPLPFARLEVEALGRVFGSEAVRTYLGKKATRAALLDELTRARRLHVAAHAEPDTDEPLRSALRLFDGKLSVGELFSRGPLAARLVVLSSCSGGRGPLGGADLVGILPRALQLAGAEQVVASSWRVSDLGAALVMKHFFRQLREQGSKLDAAEALRAAQNALRRRYQHPGFWATFRVDGLARSQTAR